MNLLDDLLERLNGLSEEERKGVVDAAVEATKHMRFVPLPGPQTEAYLSDADVLLYGGQAGGGKALALDTPIPTPLGWTTMGAIAPGDELFGADGSVCRVVAKSDVHEEDTYRITFSDGSEIVAGGNHLWRTSSLRERERGLTCTDEWRSRRRASRPSRGLGKRPDLAKRNAERASSADAALSGIRTTKEIFDTQRIRSRVNHSVDVCGAMRLPRIKALVDPYVLGAWLGDGTAANGQITGIDECVFERVAGSYEVRRHTNPVSRGVIGLKADLRSIGVLGNKHIPQPYLRGSIEQRVALLQGLMDTDGTCDDRGQCEITLTRKPLVDGVVELLHSLGIKCASRESRSRLDGRDCGPRWRVKFLTEIPAFSMPRKLIKQKRAGFRGTHAKRYIERVEQIDRVPLQCIQVDSADHMFLAGASCIPTHNSFLAVGLAQEHKRAIIFRRESSQTDGLEAAGKEIYGKDGFNGQDTEWNWSDNRSLKLAGMKEPDDWNKYAGRERDLICFDEAGEFLRNQVASMLAWNRGPAGQRCRVLLASNPPRSADGYWMTEWFGPWLDPHHPMRAGPGELRWAVMEDGSPIWVESRTQVPVEFLGRELLSFTFIPAALSDNPFRDTPEYRAKIDSLPEPLRSQLKYGDFGAGVQDELNQCIPTEWVKEAQRRWKPQPVVGVPQCSIGVDVAQGGTDKTVIAIRHDDWFAELTAIPGGETPGGADVAGKVIAKRLDGSRVIVDLGGGWGGDALKHLVANGVDAVGYMGVKESMQRTRDNQLRFANTRTEAYWRIREALDPTQPGGATMALPNDKELLADLTAPTFETKSGKGGMVIHLEPKDKLVKRLGRSPDKGDAVAMCWWSGAKAVTDATQWRKAMQSQRTMGGRTPQVLMGRKHARK